MREIYGSVKHMDKWNVHMHRNPEIRETLTTLGCSGTKLLLPSWLLGFQHEERETQFLLCWLFHLIPQRVVHLIDPNGLASPRFENQLASPRSESQLTAFFSKITQNAQPIASRHDYIHIPRLICYPGFLLWHLWLSHPPRASVNTCAQCVQPTRALSRKVLSLTKPKDKI